MISIGIDDEKLKHELQRVLEETFQSDVFNIENLILTVIGFSTKSDLTFNLKIETHKTERFNTISLKNLTISESLIDKIKKDQEKHGYKELETMIANVLEKHYDHD